MAAVAARLVDKMVVNPNNNGSCLGSADDVVRRDFKEESDSDMDYRPIPMEEPVHSIKMEEPAELKVEIVNVLCNFKTHCHLNLRKVCTEGVNVEYRKDPAVSGLLTILLSHFLTGVQRVWLWAKLSIPNPLSNLFDWFIDSSVYRSSDWLLACLLDRSVYSSIDCLIDLLIGFQS